MVRRHRSALQRIATERHVGRMIAVAATVGGVLIVVILLAIAFIG